MRRTVGRVRALGLVAAAATAATLLSPTAAAAPAPGAPNDDPAFVQVAVNNVENLPTVGLQCPGDWQDLVYYLDRMPYRPDLFLVQQISGRQQLNDYTARLSSQLGEEYRAVIAENSPKAMNSPCGTPKKYQTNAVVYRAARFSLESDPDASVKRWQAQSDLGGGCTNNNQARTKAVKVRLHDRVAGRDLSVASLHWPTAAHGGKPCTESNAREAVTEIREDGFGGDLLILGGDTNSTGLTSADNWRSWYASTNGDLGGSYGYRDALYADCAASGGVKDCLKDEWTLSSGRRIDFLLARRGSGGLPAVTAADTVEWNDGDQADQDATGSDRADRHYSDHRAVTARIHY
ncbi:hypothetical protein RM572_13925 [Streptomyces sp. DSM 42041]|uniref:Endonuclease/exonuclease/phosphatase family protein n=1 Tax=Streptomyces hazeniae TaxID=3075538 RepID=A0ABU2NS99_9ACTN|nr:hypothetical protein [Streptomyces sp. DSM 42041]MDT0379859.1 hypothetical protein [Streptomyces sp. DSM 42041]